MKRFFSCSQPQFAVLPPAGGSVSRIFGDVQFDNSRHEDLLGQMQRLRGEAYLEDGAIGTDELTSDGRHVSKVDPQSWHVLSIDRDGRVVACLRFLDEGNASSFDNLLVRHAALARCPVSGARFRRTVEREMRHARQTGIRFGEVGGWAVAQDRRLTLEPLRILLATYGLLQLLGSASGVATATVRHGSSDILRKIGLTSLQADGEDLPPYFDPAYSCQMEVLHFDSRTPNRKYIERVREFSALLASAPVICRESMAPARLDVQAVWRGLKPATFDRPLVTSLAPA